jgi:hypothetical protein
MNRILILLLMFSLLGSSCGSHSGQRDQENNTQIDSEAVSLIDDTDLLREILLSVTDGNERPGSYYCIVSDENEMLHLFSNLCGEQKYEKSYKGESTLYLYRLPEEKGILELTCFNSPDSTSLGVMSVSVKAIPDIKTISFVTSYSSDKEEEQNYSRGNLSEINY